MFFPLGSRESDLIPITLTWSHFSKWNYLGGYVWLEQSSIYRTLLRLCDDRIHPEVSDLEAEHHRPAILQRKIVEGVNRLPFVSYCTVYRPLPALPGFNKRGSDELVFLIHR